MTSTLTVSRKPQGSFLSQYKLDRKLLHRGDKARGIAALRIGTDQSGNPVLVKIWPRDPADDDNDLREIWRNELRQLYRLAGYPGVADFIVELVNSGEDELGFYLVLSPGLRRPLESILNEPGKRSRNVSSRSDQGRILLWSNLLRIAAGLESLHQQGLLHRNLSTWSILTAGGDEADFQLTGFEWSMRLIAADTQRASKRIPPSIDLRHSFVMDWHQFGQVVRDLFNISAARVENTKIATHEVSEALLADEVRLIRELLQIISTPRIDGRYVHDRIDSLITRLTIQSQRKEPKFNLVLALGRAGPLAATIREASDREIEIDDIASQNRFVENDLSSPIAMSIRILAQPAGFRLVLRGHKLTYFLDDFLGKDRSPSHWDIAYCGRVDFAVPLAVHILNQARISADALNFLAPHEARRNTRFRSRFASWEDLRRQLAPMNEEESSERRLAKSLAMGQMLEYLFAATDVFPVEIVGQAQSQDSDEDEKVRILVRVRPDSEREELSVALGMKGSPGRRLQEALQTDRYGEDEEGERKGNWILTDSAMLGDRSESSTEWQFEAIEKGPDGKPAYSFVGERTVSTRDGYLISDESIGRDSQLKRRLRSFRALGEHKELAKMLGDPRARVMKSDEVVEVAGNLETLDESKRETFKSVVETVPLFLVQGPPGVGKTRLVRELVRSRFVQDNSTRLLLSAQSNPSVDHLLHEIEGIFPVEDPNRPLTIRCKARDKKEEGSPFDISQQSKRMLQDLMSGDLFKQASTNVQERISRLAERYNIDVAQEKRGAPQQVITSARRAYEALVLRSANLVFATTNSADLERLIEERAQFDWVVIEEAGKATGGELVSPLLLSHRRLLIGDHKQLPPFNSERFLKFLEGPKAVQKALRLADPMIGRTFRDATVDEIFADLDDDENADNEQTFASLCVEAGRTFSLFETLIEDEFARQKSGKGGLPIAAQLRIQHRMHPGIAELVARTFYPNLTTDSQRENEYRSQPAPIVSKKSSLLPDSPVVWVDMPWVQNTVNKRIGDQPPAHINTEELGAVRRVLELLSPSGDKKPSLAILSPYSKQVLKLSRMLDTASVTLKEQMSMFAMPPKQKSYCGTVDSFQGNEADGVVVSLVRNNGHGSVLSALGFLADSRRMNVLISRARWKMVVVGSLDFLDSVVQIPKSPGDAYRIEFLEKLLSALRSPSVASDIRIISYATLMGGLT